MSSTSGDTKRRPADRQIDYPTSDGRPMGETDLHREIMVDTIAALKQFFAGQRVYVSGNILLFYREGDRRRHISPDVLVVKGLEHRPRDNYLLWQEGLAPQVVFEITSRTTKREDLETKFALYRDVIGVTEYFLFDPCGDYLQPQLQGYRLRAGQYEPLELVDGRLFSAELNLYLERQEGHLRLFDPAAQRWLPTTDEAKVEADRRTTAALHRAEQAEAERQRADAARQQAEAEVQRLRSELDQLRTQR